jgi:hypothetical protein
MQNCPHCEQEIQDEAVYCRHCHRDIEPPLWLISMHRCPFCAEWIDEGLEQCPMCDKELEPSQPTKVPPFTYEPPDFATDFRQRVGILETQKAPPAEEPEPTEPEPIAEPPPAEETVRISPFSRSARDIDDIRTVRSGILEDRIGVGGPGGMQTSEFEKGRLKVALTETLPNLVRRVLPVIIGLGFVIIVVVLAMGPGQRFLAQMVTATPEETIEVVPTVTTVPDDTPSPIPIAATATRQPTLTSTPTTGCVTWDQVTLEDEGKVLCVYGEVKRWFKQKSELGDIPFVAIFSEDPGTFAFIDYNRTYSSVRPGVCIMAEGEIEEMRGTRPFIDLDGEVEFCPENLESSP